MRLCICADDDYQTEGNTGLTKGGEAATKLGAALAVPEFGQDRPEGATDFNDLHQAQGLDAVALCLDKALCEQEAGKTSRIEQGAGESVTVAENPQPIPFEVETEPTPWPDNAKIGRASCRERVSSPV